MDGGKGGGGVCARAKQHVLRCVRAVEQGRAISNPRLSIWVPRRPGRLQSQDGHGLRHQLEEKRGRELRGRPLQNARARNTHAHDDTAPSPPSPPALGVWWVRLGGPAS